MENEKYIKPSDFTENWLKEIDVAVTLCDKSGKIVYMNDKSVKTFINDGGENLIGKDILECHPEPSRTQLSDMLKNKTKNVYTIEKNGIKKLILQIPYTGEGKYKGFAEFSFEIPFEMNHFIRV
ncbi:MAG: PAS domain-containing protein [Ignavibacteria bacterium]|jgi:transcriptional regulator with PAS, ATPase and Fis domain|nr:PAS domain-containing protein [Ignavibacteria bacterium]